MLRTSLVLLSLAACAPEDGTTTTESGEYEEVTGEVWAPVKQWDLVDFTLRSIDLQEDDGPTVAQVLAAYTSAHPEREPVSYTQFRCSVSFPGTTYTEACGPTGTDTCSGYLIGTGSYTQTMEGRITRSTSGSAWMRTDTASSFSMVSHLAEVVTGSAVLRTLSGHTYRLDPYTTSVSWNNVAAYPGFTDGSSGYLALLGEGHQVCRGSACRIAGVEHEIAGTETCWWE